HRPARSAFSSSVTVDCSAWGAAIIIYFRKLQYRSSPRNGPRTRQANLRFRYLSQNPAPIFSATILLEEKERHKYSNSDFVTNSVCGAPDPVLSASYALRIRSFTSFPPR